MKNTAFPSRYYRVGFVTKTIYTATNSSLTKRLIAAVPSVSNNIVAYRFSPFTHSSNPKETTNRVFFVIKKEEQMNFMAIKNSEFKWFGANNQNKQWYLL